MKIKLFQIGAEGLEGLENDFNQWVSNNPVKIVSVSVGVALTSIPKSVAISIQGPQGSGVQTHLINVALLAVLYEEK